MLSGNARLATLEGFSHRVLRFITGRIAVAITFADSQGATGHCPAVQWLLEPASGVIPPGTFGFAEQS
jgi:hypothetical protein